MGKSSTLITTSLQRSRKRLGNRLNAWSAIVSSSARDGACRPCQSRPLKRLAAKNDSFLQGEVRTRRGFAGLQERAQRLFAQHLLQPRDGGPAQAHASHPCPELDLLIQALGMRDGKARISEQGVPFEEAKAVHMAWV